MAADGIAFRFDSVAYGADKERLLNSILAMPSTATRARAGVRPGGGLEVTMTTGPDAANVAVGSGVITDTGAGAGSYPFVIPSVVTKTLTTRPSAGQARLDAVVARILNFDERPADGAGNRFVQIDVIAGTPSAGTPASPSIPAGQLRLAELTVPASGTILVAKPPPRIAALGGILPVADQAERDAISPLYDSLVVYREDLDLWEGRANTTFKYLGGGRSFTRKTSAESVTSSTTLQNDDVLAFPVLAGFPYKFEVLAFVDAASAGANGDIKFGFSFPTGTLDFTGVGPHVGDLTAGSNAQGEWIARLAATSGTTVIPFGLSPTASTPVAVTLRGTFVATNSGTVQLMWAQNASSAVASRVLAGSTILADLAA